MSKNFMEASTEASGYIEKISFIRSKIASLIVEVCEGKANGNNAGLSKDLDTMVMGLSEEDQKLVYKEAIILMTKLLGNISSTRKGRRNNNNDDDDDNLPNIFRNRGF